MLSAISAGAPPDETSRTNLLMNRADAFDFFHLATARPIYLGFVRWLSSTRWSCLCSEFIYIPNSDGLFAPPPGCGRRLIVGRPAVDPGLGLRTSPPLRMCRLVFAGVLHFPSGGPSAFGQAYLSMGPCTSLHTFLEFVSF